MPDKFRSSGMTLLMIFIFLFAACGKAQPGIDSRLNQIQMPAGFQIEVYASGVNGARSLALGENGVVFVGSRQAGRVYALIDEKGGGVNVSVVTIASGLDTPNGVAFHKGALYVAENSRILRYDNIMDKLRQSPAPVVVTDNLPRERHHGWKYIAFGPDGKLYIPVGAPYNIGVSEDTRFATIMQMNPDGSDLRIFASGVRNSVGFDWDPATKELWFTDNGRDWLGNDIPPDELNHAPREGMHFGYPHYYGDNEPDPEFKQHPKAAGLVIPAQKLGAHVAALGMKFYNGKMFPAEYRDQIFIAEHGSWNRTTPVGYRISLVRLQGGRAVSYGPFAEGWLQGRLPWGRPVDVLVMPDGALLVSDDLANQVYRISYR